MAREARKRQAEDQLGRARRPLAIALDLLDALQEAAEIDEEPGEFRTDRVERLSTRRRAAIAASVSSATPPAPPSRRPRATDAVQLAVTRGIIWPRVIVGAQALAGGELGGVDQRPAVAALAPPQPGERTLVEIDRHPASTRGLRRR